MQSRTLCRRSSVRRFHMRKVCCHCNAWCPARILLRTYRCYKRTNRHLLVAIALESCRCVASFLHNQWSPVCKPRRSYPRRRRRGSLVASAKVCPKNTTGRPSHHSSFRQGCIRLHTGRCCIPARTAFRFPIGPNHRRPQWSRLCRCGRQAYSRRCTGQRGKPCRKLARSSRFLWHHKVGARILCTACRLACIRPGIRHCYKDKCKIEFAPSCGRVCKRKRCLPRTCLNHSSMRRERES